MELIIGLYGGILITSAGDVFKTSVGDIPWCYMRTVWGHPGDGTLERRQDVIFQRPKDVGRGLSLALHRGPNGDVHRMFFGDVLRT